MADKVSIDIPGVGLVEANNAAQESTLREILAAIEKSGSGGGGGGGGSTAAVDAANTKAKKENTDETEKNTDRMERWGKNTAKVTKEVGSAAKGVASALTGSGGVAESIKSVGEVIEKSLGGLPIFGAAMGAAVGFLTAQISATIDSFTQAQASGASFGNSFSTFTDIASQAGLTMGQFSAVAKQAGESLSMFGGGTAQGARDFARFNNAVRNSGMDKQMLRMGMSFQDQAVAMADYTGQLATYGERVSSLDTQSVAKNFFELTKQQKMLSQYNGITLEQQRQDMKAKQKDVNLRALTIGMDAKQQEAALALSSQLTKLGGPVAEQYMKEMLAHGSAVSAETALFAQSFPELAKMANEGAAGLKAGTLETADTMRMMGQLDPVAMKAQAVAAGETLKMMIGTGVSNPLTEMTSQTLVPALDTIAKAINKTANKIQADDAKLAKPADAATEIYLSAEVATQNMKKGMEDVARALLKGGKFNDALLSFSSEMEKASKKFGDFAFDANKNGVGTAAKTMLGIDLQDSSKEQEKENLKYMSFGEHVSTAIAEQIESIVGVVSETGAELMRADRVERDTKIMREEGRQKTEGSENIGKGPDLAKMSISPLAVASNLYDFFMSSEDKPKGKASGGPVNAGSKYEVNEIGQELFTPSTQGTISPHSAYKNLMSNMSDLVSDIAGMKTRLEKQQGLETKAPSGVADFAGVISGIMQAGNGLFDTLKTNITDNMSRITSSLTGNNLFGTLATDIMDDMSGITSALTGNNLFGNLATDITGMISNITSQSNIDQESMTQGTAEISNVYKNIMVDMAGMKAQLAEQQTDTIQPVLPATAESPMSQVASTPSNPFSEDQEVRNALISLPSIMMENMKHLQTVNNTLEVKLTELSRNVA